MRDSGIGNPGAFPFTRGIQPTMYRGRPWTMRQYAGFATAEESNARYRYLLSQGVTGLSVAFDLPTQIGYDSDHPLAAGEVGRVGVAIDSIEDMSTLFDGIPLDQVSTSMTINATAIILLALYVAVARRQGVPIRALSGTVQNDILKEYVARGTYIYPPRPSLRIVTDIMAFCARDLPEWNTISISGYHIREAGSTAVQELAFTIADGLAYVDEALSLGLAIDDFAPRLSFFFNAHSDFFEEIAKYRAARRIWATELRDRYGARTEEACRLRFHTQTAGVSLTAQQPMNNVVRTTVEALAAVLGGTQSLHTNALDEVLALPTAAAAKLALRTQQVIAHETGVASVADPLGGSYFVEALTDRMEERAREEFERIRKLGDDGSMLEGVLAGIEEGYFQAEIAESAFREQERLEAGDLVKVGVNAFVEEGEEPLDTLVIGPEAEREAGHVQRRRRAVGCERMPGADHRRHEADRDRVGAAVDRVEREAAEDGGEDEDRMVDGGPVPRDPTAQLAQLGRADEGDPAGRHWATERHRGDDRRDRDRPRRRGERHRGLREGSRRHGSHASENSGSGRQAGHPHRLAPA